MSQSSTSTGICQKASRAFIEISPSSRAAGFNAIKRAFRESDLPAAGWSHGRGAKDRFGRQIDERQHAHNENHIARQPEPLDVCVLLEEFERPGVPVAVRYDIRQLENAEREQID